MVWALLKIDYHFRTIFDLCTPCKIRYSYYGNEEGMQLNGNHVDGEILSVTKNKNAFTEL